MRVLVTGGAGYIGSHTVVELLAAGHEAIVVDNLCNASPRALEAVEKLTGRKIPFYRIDVRDSDALRAVLEKEKPDSCIHFAGLKAVGDSVKDPLAYYDNNVWGTVKLAQVMTECGCRNIIFSSSATVYGEPKEVPIPETHPRGECASPYGRSKSMVEQVLTDLQSSDPSWNVVLLRYFNPIGAHPSGEIGEDPRGVPNNLMPYITQVAVGRREALGVFGNDYDTPDGTGVRDYIHVVDLARGHVKALEAIEKNCGLVVYNLGTGKGCSVLEVVHAFEEATGVKVPCRICPRRPGDIASYYADPSKAKRELGWQAEYDISVMCRDSWNWQYKHPNGFAK